MEIFANFGIVKTSASGILTDLFREVQGDLFPSVTLIQKHTIYLLCVT